MSVNRTWLKNYRHQARVVRVGWFKKQVVFVLQQEYQDMGTYYEPDWENCEREIYKTGWADVTTLDYLDLQRGEM